MTSERIIKMGSGDYRETTVKDNATYVEGDYYNNPEQKKNLTEIAEEITDLLNYFEQNNPSITDAMQVVNAAKERQPELNNDKTIKVAIENTPSLQQRLEAAGKAAYIGTVKLLLPPFGIAIEVIKAWNSPK